MSHDHHNDPATPYMRACLESAVDDVGVRARWTTLTTVWPNLERSMLAYAGYVFHLVPPSNPGHKSNLHEVVATMCADMDLIDQRAIGQSGDRPSYRAVIRAIVEQKTHLAGVVAYRKNLADPIWTGDSGPLSELFEGQERDLTFKVLPQRVTARIVADTHFRLLEHTLAPFQQAFVRQNFPDLAPAIAYA